MPKSAFPNLQLSAVQRRDARDARYSAELRRGDAFHSRHRRLRRAGGPVVAHVIDAAAARTPAAPHVERRRRRLARLDAKAVRTRALRPCEKRGKK